MDSPSIWRRVRRDVALLGAGSAANIAAQLVFRSILLNALVPAAYGRLSLVLSIYNAVWIVGASGLPNGVARYIATLAPADDSAIVRSALRAGAWPIAIAAALVAVPAAIILGSPWAFLYGAVGLASLGYAFIITGILRGRGRFGSASSLLESGSPFALRLLKLQEPPTLKLRIPVAKSPERASTARVFNVVRGNWPDPLKSVRPV